MKIKLVAFNGRYIHSCLALFYVREELRRHLPAAEMEFHQLTINDPYYDTLQKIAAGKPDAIFLSVYIWNGELVLRLLGDLAQVLRESLFILGGPQAEAIDRNTLPENCTVVSGEIEGLPETFYRDLEARALAPAYRGVPGRPFPSPYNDDDLGAELKNRHVYYESSRGCPFSCSYCLSSVERGVTWKEVEEVKSELKMIVEHSPKIVKFVDRTFNARPERALEIWRFLAELDTQTVFHFEMAPDLFTEEMFDFLAGLPPGHFQFELGIQSTNPATLTAVNRKMDLAGAGANIRRLAAMNNIHLHADLILGLPGETPETFRRSINEVFTMAPHYIQMGLLKVLPGTAIASTPGLISCRKPPYEILANSEMDPETIAHFHQLGECLEAFHNNRYFPSFFASLRESGEDICAFFEKLLKLCQKRNFFELSTTQELLSGLLCEVVSDREDGELLRELILFDWLRCGHRFLPGPFAAVDLAGLRKSVGSRLPQALEPFFDYRSRDRFLSRTIFVEFSGQALKQLGLDDDGSAGIVCFLPERTEGIHSFQKVTVLPGLG